MKLGTKAKAGSVHLNHNQATGLKLKTKVKVGGMKMNNNQTRR